MLNLISSFPFLISSFPFLISHFLVPTFSSTPAAPGSVQNLDSGLWTGPWTGLWTGPWTGLWTVLGQLRLAIFEFGRTFYGHDTLYECSSSAISPACDVES